MMGRPQNPRSTATYPTGQLHVLDSTQSTADCFNSHLPMGGAISSGRASASRPGLREAACIIGDSLPAQFGLMGATESPSVRIAWRVDDVEAGTPKTLTASRTDKSCTRASSLASMR